MSYKEYRYLEVFGQDVVYYVIAEDADQAFRIARAQDPKINTCQVVKVL